MTDTHAATELELFVENDRDLYRSMTTPIHKNLATKKARGQYKHDLAVKAFMHLMEAGAKKYAKEFGGTWHQIFNVPTRRHVAEQFTKEFEVEHSLGAYDHLLPKKYQKKPLSPNHARVKTPSSKKAKWNVPDGLVVRWAPANNAWFALWPASAPVNKQQVLKIGGTEEMHDWLRDRYGESFGLTSRVSGHSTIRSGYARKRSPAQLDREIAYALSSHRGGR